MNEQELNHKLKNIATPLRMAKSITTRLKGSCECPHCTELDLILRTVLNAIDKLMEVGDEVHKENVLTESLKHNPREEKR